MSESKFKNILNPKNKKNFDLGSFIVRQSRHSNSYALSLTTFEKGVQHILVQQDNHQWQISSGTASSLKLPSFQSVPHLVVHYQQHKLPIKGCQREVYLK